MLPQGDKIIQIYLFFNSCKTSRTSRPNKDKSMSLSTEIVILFVCSTAASTIEEKSKLFSKTSHLSKRGAVAGAFGTYTVQQSSKGLIEIS